MQVPADSHLQKTMLAIEILLTKRSELYVNSCAGTVVEDFAFLLGYSVHRNAQHLQVA